ncbi:Oidioi.mRNA.OKI2018_I69.PAR.g9958.t1.cds [Oikopleura dioica]|uniref:Oidioi.mRNA.OKI2018_I69.PAR.g9958.t1.cds n=1 Tax=Oikopleura dioica TaxID=34765 RepID=A0ABN7RRQ4_OIKDI|nr:Oidioi.mRNA.OKI2018_I69.PAR.g9958.t1.cds [Oikopleura dioica]
MRFFLIFIFLSTRFALPGRKIEDTPRISELYGRFYGRNVRLGEQITIGRELANSILSMKTDLGLASTHVSEEFAYDLEEFDGGEYHEDLESPVESIPAIVEDLMKKFKEKAKFDKSKLPKMTSFLPHRFGYFH